MRIAFHIPRMNWYRVLSSLIDEALHRGHYVECWHHKGAKLKENTPVKKKIPLFKYGKPIIVEYDNPRDIIELISSRKVDIIIDVYPPRYSEILTLKEKNGGKPLWALIDLPPSDCLTIEIKNEQQLYGCDKFIVCNEFYLESSIRLVMQDKEELLKYTIKRNKELGVSAADWVKNNFMFQWNETHANYLRNNVFIAGNCAFDIIPQINPNEIRQRWGIEQTDPVISLLPCPFGFDHTAPWEQMFMRDSFISRLKWIFRYMRFEYLLDISSWPSNTSVVESLKQFAVNNKALLIAKKRHSRQVTPELAKYCDRIVGDDNFYPHTALELFSISELVVGFYSFGSIEAVALNSPYLNVNIPDFTWKYYCDMRTSIHNCEPYDGVISSMTADDIINKLPYMKLSDFELDSNAREKYLKKFASWPIDGASGSIMKFLESKDS